MKQKKKFYKRWWFWVLVVILIGAIGSGIGSQGTDDSSTSKVQKNSSSKVEKTSSAKSSSSKQSTSASSKSSAPANTAKEVTLNTGEWTVGTDIQPGRYTITPVSGSGNLTSTGSGQGTDINEILGQDDGMGVASVTTDLTRGEKVKLDGIPQAKFSPVVSRNSANTTALSTGTWIVGKDLKAGRYNVSPDSGQSGNFTVDGSTSVNEILGDGGTSKVTMTVENGDVINVSGMTGVQLSPYN